MGKIMRGNELYGIAVEANPKGFASEELRSLKVGDDIYKVVGGGGGGSEAYSTALLWDYVEDNSGSVLFGTYTVTLHDSIDNYDQIIIEGVSYSGDIASGSAWSGTNQIVMDVNALNNSYNPGYFVYTSFDQRSSRWYANDITLSKTIDNQANTNGLVHVYGIKYTGGSGGGSGYSKTNLWKGEQTTDAELQLSEVITNYDIIEFVCGFNSTDKAHMSFTYDVQQFLIDFPYVANPTNTVPHFLPCVYDTAYFRAISGSSDDKIYVWEFSGHTNPTKLYEINGIKLGSGGGGGNPYVDDVIWESETGVSGTTTIESTSPLSDYDAVYFVTSATSDGGYANRYSTVIANIFKDETATHPVRVLTYPTYGNRYIILDSDFDDPQITVTTGLYNESSGYVPIVYEIHGIKFGSGGGTGGAGSVSELADVELTNLSNGQILQYNSTTQKWENADNEGGSGGSGFTNDILFENLESTNPSTITLTSQYTDYDEVVIKYTRPSNEGDYTWHSTFLVESLPVNSYVELTGWQPESQYLHYIFTNETTLTLYNQNGGVIIREIYGLKFGGGSSKLKEETLWFNETGSGNGTYTLSKNIDGYDAVVLYYGIYSEYTDSPKITDYRIVTVDDLNKMNDDGAKILLSGYTNRALWVGIDGVTVTVDSSDYNVLIEVRGIKFGSSSGTDVEANPVGEPTAELNTIRIGEDIFEVVGGSGKGYSFTNLWTGSQSTAGEITLNDNIENYDLIQFICQISNGGCSVDTFDTNYFLTEFPYKANPTANDKHYCPNTWDTSYARVITGSSTDKLYTWEFYGSQRITAVNGIKLEGNSRGSSYKEEVIFSTSTDDATYPLDSPLSNYDMIYVTAKFIGSGGTGNDNLTGCFSTTELLNNIGGTYGITSGEDAYAWFTVTSDSLLTRGAHVSYMIKEIRGIKFGGSSSSEKTDTYSTDEQVSGTWIDGKPIYKKTFSTNIHTNGQEWVNTGIVITDIGKIINYEVVAEDTYVGNAPANLKSCSFRYYNSNIQINVDQQWYLDILAVTVWYTKSTD